MQRVTITIPDETLEGAREAVAEGRAENVSALIAEAAAHYLREDSLLGILEALDTELGKPSEQDFEWARRVLDR